jgi:uracil-DNA glycosylase
MVKCLLLKNELTIINPDVVIALGNDTYSFLSKHLIDMTDNNRFSLFKVRHPARNGQKQCKFEIDKILELM